LNRVSFWQPLGHVFNSKLRVVRHAILQILWYRAGRVKGGLDLVVWPLKLGNQSGNRFVVLGLAHVLLACLPVMFMLASYPLGFCSRLESGINPSLHHNHHSPAAVVATAVSGQAVIVGIVAHAVLYALVGK